MSGYVYDLTAPDAREEISWYDGALEPTDKSTWERLFSLLKRGQDLIFGRVIDCKCKQTTVTHGGYTGYGGSNDYRFADLNEETETVPCLPSTGIDLKLKDANGTTFKGVLIERSYNGNNNLGPDDTSVRVWIKIKVTKATVLKMYAMYVPDATNDIIDTKIAALDKRIEKATAMYEWLKVKTPNNGFNIFNAKQKVNDLQKMKTLLLQGKIASEQ